MFYKTFFNVTLIQDCGGTHATSTGIITSPRYPLNYYNNNDGCLWIIHMPSTYSGINLRFTSFNTHSSNDFVEVVSSKKYSFVIVKIG